MAEDPIDEAVSLLDTSEELRQAGHLASASRAAERALTILEAECGYDHPDVANALQVLGQCREDLCQYDAAESCYRRAVDVAEGWAAEADEAVQRIRVQTRMHLGQIERIHGRLPEAHRILIEAVALADQQLGPTDPDTAAALNALGIVCKYGGRFAEGEAAYHRALAIIEATLGADSPDAATIHHNLGGIAFDAGNFSAAEAPARRAVALRQAAVGSEHPAVAAELAALAPIVDALGRHDEAERLYRRALAILERSEGADYDLAVLHNNLGVAAAERHDTDAAERHYMTALDIKERLLGPDHPDVGMTLFNLGQLAHDTGRDDEARLHLQRALSIFEASFEANHTKLADCRAALTDLA